MYWITGSNGEKQVWSSLKNHHLLWVIWATLFINVSHHLMKTHCITPHLKSSSIVWNITWNSSWHAPVSWSSDHPKLWSLIHLWELKPIHRKLKSSFFPGTSFALNDPKALFLESIFHNCPYCCFTDGYSLLFLDIYWHEHSHSGLLPWKWPLSVRLGFLHW